MNQNLPHGLSIGKGQRFEDLKIANSDLSEEELQRRLDHALEEGLVESNRQLDDVYYFRCDTKK